MIMRDLIKTILILCKGIAGLSLVFYVIVFIQIMWGCLRHKTPVNWADLNPIKMFCTSIQKGNIKGTIIFSMIFILGISYTVLEHFYTTTEIGAFFEKRGEFDEQYEATVYIEDKPVFCIVDISKIIDPENKSTDYYITQIALPYGEINYDVWTDYNPNKENNKIYLGHNWWTSCEIIVGKVATDRSYEVLENTVVTAYGELCGSISGDKCHYNWCPSAQNISDENKVFFSSEQEADILGYEPCSLCFGY